MSLPWACQWADAETEAGWKRGPKMPKLRIRFYRCFAQTPDQAAPRRRSALSGSSNVSSSVQWVRSRSELKHLKIALRFILNYSSFMSSNLAALVHISAGYTQFRCCMMLLNIFSSRTSNLDYNFSPSCQQPIDLRGVLQRFGQLWACSHDSSPQIINTWRSFLY